MNCNDLNQTLIEGSPLSPEAEEHLKSCARCRELVGALSVPVPEASPSPATLDQIERAIVEDLRPVRPIAPKVYIFGAFVAIFASIAALGVYRLGAFALAVMSPHQVGVILAALAISAGLLAYSLVNQMVPGSRHRIPQIHCPNLDARHILVAHLGVAVLGVITGFIVGLAVENKIMSRRP